MILSLLELLVALVLGLILDAEIYTKHSLHIAHFHHVLHCVWKVACCLGYPQVLVCQIAEGPWQRGRKWQLAGPGTLQMQEASQQPSQGKRQSPSHLQKQIIALVCLCVCVCNHTLMKYMTNRLQGEQSETKYERNHATQQFCLWTNNKCLILPELNRSPITAWSVYKGNGYWSLAAVKTFLQISAGLTEIDGQPGVWRWSLLWLAGEVAGL